jgi:RNA polymerase sigma-70 factor (ECF subfamily)
MTEPSERRKTTAIAAALSHTVDWRLAYEQHAPDLVRFLRRFVVDEAAAQDLLHDAFARAMRSSHPPVQAEVRPWLFRVATNAAVDDLRRRRRLAFLPLRGHGTVPGPNYGEVDHVRRALRAIAPEQAVTLTLALHEGFSRREIAELTGVSEEAVKSRLARGRLAFAAAYRRMDGAVS